MVGAHNALYTYGERTGLFSLKRMKDCHDYEEAKRVYQKIKFPPVKIVLTGTGRVGSGAAEVLLDMGITQVSPEEFLSEDNHEPVFTQLACSDYAARKNGGAFNQDEFYRHPEHFKSIFTPYYEVADIMINGIYWDNKAPAFFSREDMRQAEFQIQVIADVTCDIAPVSSIPSTLKASTIEHPVFGYDPHTGAETQPYQPDAIDMMTIDNLPNELPRDASTAFGQQFIEHILHELVRAESDILERATIARDGKLTERYEYLSDYVSKHE
jgi:saccharopine dehydrogenase (NAD+, L-lysine-forming)